MKLKAIGAATLLAVVSCGALADDQSITLSQTGTGVFGASFSTMETVSGLFVDTFMFSLPASFSGGVGSGSLTFGALSGPVSLVVASLDAANGVSVASPSDADSVAIPSTLSYSNATAPLTLTVLGFAGDPFAETMPLAAGYSGTITFNASVAAVPEPETYALMLGGLAGIGLVLRRRKARDALCAPDA